MKMKYFLSIFLSALVFSAQAQKQLVLDENAEVRQVSGSFSSIRVSSGINLYLSKGDAEAIAVSASSDKYKDAIKTEIENGELHIFYSGEKFHYGNNAKISVYVAYRNLAHLTASGASDVVLAGVLDVPSLDLQLSGASDLKGEVKLNELNVKLSGASDVKLSGTAGAVNIESSGASDFKAYGLIAETCNAKASGASDVNITVTKEISANANGASDIFYKGPAELKIKESSGASTIARRE